MVVLLVSASFGHLQGGTRQRKIQHCLVSSQMCNGTELLWCTSHCLHLQGGITAPSEELPMKTQLSFFGAVCERGIRGSILVGGIEIKLVLQTLTKFLGFCTVIIYIYILFYRTFPVSPSLRRLLGDRNRVCSAERTASCCPLLSNRCNAEALLCGATALNNRTAVFIRLP